MNFVKNGKSVTEQIRELEDKIHKAERERDTWHGKPSEHHKMASLMVESLKQKLAELVVKHEC